MLALKEKVSASLTRYNMLSPGDGVGVGVSGGADSVTLLHLLHGLALYRIVVLHVNHELRGKESDEDEQFVRELAEKLGLPVEAKRSPVGNGNLEQEARDARREFFAEARLRLNLRAVALGHNQSDQAETVLYRFLRGSGVAGLAGMLPVTVDGLIRPMLDLTREEVRAWAAEQGIAWREDSTNRNTEFARNRLRLEVFNPQLVRVLSANATVAQDEERWWEERIAHLYRVHAKQCRLGVEFLVGAFESLHVAEQRRLIRFAIHQVKGDLKSVDLLHVEGIRKLLDSQAGHNRLLIPGIDALRSFGTLLLMEPGKFGAEERHYDIRLEIGAELALPYDGGRLYVNWVTPEGGFCGNFGEEETPAEEIILLDGEVLRQGGMLQAMHVRNWEPGDEYRRTGHKNAEKIKSLFQEYRILLWERRRWPVLVINGEIIWARRFGVAAKFQATGESRYVIRVVYRSGISVREAGSD